MANINTDLKNVNKVSFYYRKDLNVTKHGEFIAGEDMMAGDIVKVDLTTGLVTKALTADDAVGIVDIIRYNIQGPDTLAIAKGERVRVGIGMDVEIVTLGGHPALEAVEVGGGLTVTAGKLTAGEGYGKVVHKFANGEVVVRIPFTETH